MKNDTNIYDFDGKLLRKAGDNHKITIKEAQELMSFYGKKSEENPENTEIYRTYIRNLSNYVYNMISQMSPEEFTEYLKENTPETPKTTEEEVKEALKDVSKTLTQEDMLVERDTEAPKMDEYVDYEEA